MDKKEKNMNGYPPYDDDKFYDIAKTVSTNDCTGLQPTPPKDEDAADSYADLCNIPHVNGNVNNGLQNIKKAKNNEDVAPDKGQ